jgi:hypothetical protein
MRNYFSRVENTTDFLEGKSQMIVNLMDADTRPDTADLTTHLRMVYGHVDWDNLVYKLDEETISLLKKHEDCISMGKRILCDIHPGKYVAIVNADAMGPLTYQEMKSGNVMFELYDLDDAKERAAFWYVDDLLGSLYSFSLFTPYFVMALRLAVMEGHMSDEERFSEDRLNDVWCKTYSSILSLVAFKLMQQACHIEKECAIVPFNLSDYLIKEYYEASGYEESTWD